MWMEPQDVLSSIKEGTSIQGQQESVAAQLLHSALDRDERATGNAILANFEIACFHMHVLITQVIFFDAQSSVE